MMQVLEVQTSRKECLVNVTPLLQAAITRQGWRDGVLVMFCPHTTAALTINEAADPDVASDMVAFLAAHIPASSTFRHAEGNSDAHIKASLLGSNQMCMVGQGLLLLGTWQGVYMYEGDGPRTRSLWLQFLAAS